MTSVDRAQLVRGIAGLCLVVVAAPSTRMVPGQIRSLFPLSIGTLTAAGIIVTWGLLMAGGVGLLMARPWAFALVYVAAVTNIVPGYAFVAFTFSLARQLLPGAALEPVLLAVNGLFVVAVVWAHVVLRRSQQPGGIDSSRD